MPTSRTPEELEQLSETPMTREELKTARRAPRIKIIRRALGLTLEEFSERYRIPLGTLRDWEQGRSEPDAPARAFLEVIAHEPEVAAKALRGRDAA
jgi:putative transcriptional regulator